MSWRDDMQRRLPDGYYLRWYSPGDGKTRYKIVREEGGSTDYFGGRDVGFAVGKREAEVIVEAFIAGYLWRERDNGQG